MCPHKNRSATSRGGKILRILKEYKKSDRGPLGEVFQFYKSDLREMLKFAIDKFKWALSVPVKCMYCSASYCKRYSLTAHYRVKHTEQWKTFNEEQSVLIEISRREREREGIHFVRNNCVLSTEQHQTVE